LWGNARDLKFADGKNADEAFSSKANAFTEPIMPLNVLPTANGLHGAVWFEAIYQHTKDKTGKTLLYLILMTLLAKHGVGMVRGLMPHLTVLVFRLLLCKFQLLMAAGLLLHRNQNIIGAHQ
jgi:hypothetical protein